MKSLKGFAITGLLEAAINRYLAEEPNSAAAVTALNGKVIALYLSDSYQPLSLCFIQDQVFLSTDEHTEPDVELTGSPLALAQFFLSPGKNSKQLSIRGDLDTCSQLHALFSNIEIDWEEHLSKLVGDVVAHQVGRHTKKTKQNYVRSTRNFSEDVRDYLQEEIKLVVHPVELRGFTTKVSLLNSEVDRIATRVSQLIARASGEHT